MPTEGRTMHGSFAGTVRSAAYIKFAWLAVYVALVTKLCLKDEVQAS